MMTASTLLILAVVTAANPTPPAPGLLALDAAATKVLAADAERIGLALRPEIASRIEAVRTRLAVEQLVLDKVKPSTPTEAEVRAAFRATAHTANLQLVARSSRADAAAALERLRKGAAVGDEAKQSSDATTRERAGELGWVARGQMPPAVAADAFTGALATWRGPYEVGGQWHVVRVKERRMPAEDPAALKQVRARLVAERRERAHDAYMARLRQRAKVVIDEPFITSAAVRKDLSPGERDHVVATVGSRKLRYADMIAAAGGIQAPHRSSTGAAGMQIAIARQLVDRLLLEQEAVRAKLAERPAVAKKIRAAREEILVAAYYDEVAAKTPEPTKAEIEARYKERSSDFRAPAARRCAHLVVSSEETVKKLQARAARGEPFEKLAREASEHKESAEKGGDLGEVPDERLARMDPGLAAAIRKLGPAKVSDPVKTAMGWHLLRCEPVPERLRHLVEVDDRIAAAIRHERTTAVLNARVAELEAGATKGATPGVK